MSDQMKIEERVHRVNSDRMEITVTVEDPKYFTRPWVAMDKQAFRLQPADFSMAETRCSPSEMAAYDRLVSSPIVK